MWRDRGARRARRRNAAACLPLPARVALGTSIPSLDRCTAKAAPNPSSPSALGPCQEPAALPVSSGLSLTPELSQAHGPLGPRSHSHRGSGTSSPAAVASCSPSSDTVNAGPVSAPKPPAPLQPASGHPPQASAKATVSSSALQSLPVAQGLAPCPELPATSTPELSKAKLIFGHIKYFS